MATVDVGQQAPIPDGTLEDAEGASHDLRAALGRGPILLGLYKSSCQASKTMFPFLERLHRRYGGDGLSVYGVSQDSANVTRSFARRLELSFPILIEGEGYPLSAAFGITATPTVFLLAPDGTVTATTMGFFKGPVNELGDAAAAAVGREPAPLVTEEDAGVPVFVPG
jgi:peroxiredoxin